MNRLLDSAALLEPARSCARAGRLARKRFRWAWRRRFGRLDRQLIEQYVETSMSRRLHLGAGNHELTDWLNSDLYPDSKSSIHLDVTCRFPLPDRSFQYIFSEHMIEHLSYREGEAMLRECFRVLEPGGVVRISTPDLTVLLNLFQDCSSPTSKRYMDWHLDWINRDDAGNAPERTPTFVLNNFMRDWGHQFVYDNKTLSDLLRRCGFESIVQCRLNESEHEPLRLLENEARAPAGLIQWETMTLEGLKT